MKGIAVLALIWTSTQAGACPACERGQELLIAGDTTRAITLLRESVKEDWAAKSAGLLGSLLVEVASMRAVEFEERLEGEKLLHAAIRADGENRGTGANETCAVTFCLNYERPQRFHDILFTFPPQDSLAKDEARLMRENFERAVAIDPSYSIPVRSRLSDLAREERWEDYIGTVENHLNALAPGGIDEGWAHVFNGAGLTRAGHPQEAHEAFALGLALLNDAELGILEDISNLVRRQVVDRQEERSTEQQADYRNILWTTMDPLYITDYNERRLEHLTRVALASRAPPNGFRSGSHSKLPELDAGPYKIRVEVTDRADGAVAISERTIEILEVEAEGVG